ncbi:MAG: hypothetical protein K2Z81_25855 [Cyanobacteria bacterium]|nr:hypothetical protein [Cyanobacteriota bacterium]
MGISVCRTLSYEKRARLSLSRWLCVLIVLSQLSRVISPVYAQDSSTSNAIAQINGEDIDIVQLDCAPHSASAAPTLSQKMESEGPDSTEQKSSNTSLSTSGEGVDQVTVGSDALSTLTSSDKDTKASISDGTRSSSAKKIVQAEIAGQSDFVTQIDTLTKQIASIELDFESFYTRYRITGPADPKWRYDRYTLFQEAAAGLTLGSNIPFLTESAANLGTPFDVDSHVIKRATRVGLIGVIFQGGSSSLELASNTLIYFKNKSKKIDPVSVLKDVRARLKAIDTLWSQRRALVEEHQDHPNYKAWVCEGRVLKTFRDWSVYEFAEVYADVRSYQASANVYYILDAASSAAYYASFDLSIKGYKRETLFGPSGITGVVGDGLGIISAPGSYASYNLLTKFWMWRVGKQLGEKPRECEEETLQAVVSLDKILAGYAPSSNSNGLDQLRSRMMVYKSWVDRNEFAEKRMVDYRHSSRVALQDEISGPLISSAFLAQDITGVLSAYRFSEKSDNELFFATSIPTTAASVASLGLTAYWWIDAKRFENQLIKQNASPHQLMEARVSLLKRLKESINH